MAVSVRISSLNQCLQFRYVFRVCEVNDIYCYIVSLHPYAQLFELLFLFPQRMSYEKNDALTLALVLPMLKAQLSYFHTGEEISLPLDFNLIDGI